MNKLIIVAGAGVIALTTASMLTNGFGVFEPHTAPMPESIQLIASKKNAKGLKPYDKPQEANDFYREKRLAPGESELPIQRYLEAKKTIAKMKRYVSSESKVYPSKIEQTNNKTSDGPNEEIDTWESIGPGNIGGRTRALLIDPTSPDTMYLGGVAGGIWKTVNGGESWSPLTDLMSNIAISSMTFAHNNSNVIYAGTGEGFFNGDAVRGNGIFVSQDAGANWEPIASTLDNSDFYYVNKIVASPNNSNTLYVATQTGILKSTNAGDSWTRIYEPSGSFVGCTDLKIRTDVTTDHLLTACGSFSPGQVARSTDGGATWQTVLSGDNMARTTLAIAPSNQSIVYALSAAYEATPTNLGRHGVNAVYRSDDGGETWQTQFKIDDNVTPQNDRLVATGGGFGMSLLTNTLYGMLPNCNFFSWNQSLNQGWYDNIITVDPVNPDVVWAGGIDIFRSDDAGATWGLTSSWFNDIDDPYYAHADQHIKAFHPQYDGVNNKVLFVGNDGGIQKTSDALAATLTVQEYCDFVFGDPLPESGRVNWERLNNNLGITQFYHGDASADGTLYIAGAQDNGTNLGNDTLGSEAWYEISGGDGGYVAIDPTNPNIMFGEFTGLSIQKSTNGGQSWSSASNGITGGGFPFITTFAMDKNNPQRLWILGSEIWRTDDQADNWVQASMAPSDGSTGRSIGIANTNSNHVMVGTNTGLILRNTNASSADASTQWQEVQLTNGYISSIAYDPTDESIAYATVSSFGRPHVWKTTDGGLNWLAIDNQGEANGIPDIPAHSVAIDPVDNLRVFVGTDLGVFVTIDGGENWMVENGGFANTPTETLKFVGRKLFAFTHGRGAYRVDLNDLLRVSNIESSVDEDNSISWSLTNLTDMISDRPNTGTLVDGIQILTLPENGQLLHNQDVLAVGSTIALSDFTDLEYSPNADFFGDDSFSWSGTQDSNVITRSSMVSVTVQPVNDAPTLSQAIDDISTQTSKRLNINLNDYFTDIDSTLSFTANNLPNELSISTNGDIVGKLDKKFNGEITITATDGEYQVNTSFNLRVKEHWKDKLGGSLGFSFLVVLALCIRRKRY